MLISSFAWWNFTTRRAHTDPMSVVLATLLAHALSATPDCLCVFDVDRTLTAAQNATSCTGSVVLKSHDVAYQCGQYGRQAADAAAILHNGPCSKCYVGVITADNVTKSSGKGDWVLNLITNNGKDNWRVSSPSGRIPQWTAHDGAISAFLFMWEGVEKAKHLKYVMNWFNFTDESKVYFFDDKEDNVVPFYDYSYNAAQISCSQRAKGCQKVAGGVIGWCGVESHEVDQLFKQGGVTLCN